MEEEILARGYTVKYFRSDNGTEYNEVRAFNNTRGIYHEWSPPWCQSMDGTSEVYWREVFKIARAIMWDQQPECKWWAAALCFADTIRNHLITTAVNDVPPEAAWRKTSVDTTHFKVPLTDCWAYIDPQVRTDKSLGPRRMKGVFVGYATNSPCYLIYNAEANKIFSRRWLWHQSA